MSVRFCEEKYGSLYDIKIVYLPETHEWMLVGVETHENDEEATNFSVTRDDTKMAVTVERA